ncbi:MAG: glycosyltransferase family 39 protein, partial [Bellilinea sp.]
PSPDDPLPAPQPHRRLIGSFGMPGWGIWLFAAALAVYLAIRLVGLAHFPIYFFTDEAIQTVTAADLIHNQFRGPDGEFLPTFFKNGGQYNLSLSVYLQVVPTLLFGKSVFVTRAVSVWISLLAALSIGMALKNGFGSRSAWVGALLLAVTPTWFLHSRTAFETVLAVSFYAGFLYCYLLYRQGKPGYLYAGVIFAALTFYSYSPGQVVIALTALLLFLSDIRYHWQQRKTVLRGVILALALAIPYLRFQINHPGETLRHLTILDSYWVQDGPISEKLARYTREYLNGLNPLYWYDLTPSGLIRHIMKGYTPLWLPALPFVVFGFGLALTRIRKPEYRAVLAALLAAPAGGALVGLGITRMLFMVVPTALLGGIGFSTALEWLIERLRQLNLRERLFLGISLIVFIVMSVAGGFMLRDALVNGPTWYDDYGLAGMQYGGDNLFSAVRSYLAENPQSHILLSPSWANGTDVIARFFFDDPLPFTLGSVAGHLGGYIPIGADEVFILLPEELEQVRASKKFKTIEIERAVNYPNGQPGFYFTRLAYVDGADAVFEQERNQRHTLKEETLLLLDGTEAAVAYSALDIGVIKSAFDGNPNSLIRTFEANPFKISLAFSEARPMDGLQLRVGGVATRVSALVYVAGESLPRSFSVEGAESPAPRELFLDFYETRMIKAIQFEILNIRDSEPAHVHLWEISFY